MASPFRPLMALNYWNLRLGWALGRSKSVTNRVSHYDRTPNDFILNTAHCGGPGDGKTT